MLVPFLLVACLVAFSVADYPPTGMYASFAEANVDAITLSATNDINSYIANYHIPPANGSSNSGTYQFFNFNHEIEVAAFQYSSGSENDLSFGWNAVYMFVSWTYHICANDILHPCEDGTIYVYTPNDNQKTVTADATLTLSQQTASFTYNSANFNFETGDVMIWTFCSDSICVIPTSDISQSVASQFNTVVQTLFKDVFSTVGQKYVDNLHMDFTFDMKNYGSIEFVEQGNWFVNPDHSTITPGFIVAPRGAAYVDENGQVTPPPFAASTVPPDSALQSPAGGLSLFLTDYFFSTLVWALGDMGFFTREITNSEVPAMSPVKLLTNDSFFLSAVPGLASYPGDLIRVDTKLGAFAQTTIDSNGIHLAGNSLAVMFTVYNSTVSSIGGWSIAVDLDVDIALNITGTSNSLSFQPSLTNFNPQVTILHSDFTNVSAAAFVDLFQLLEGVIKLPESTVKLPAAIVSTGVASSFNTDYLQVDINFDFSPSPKSVKIQHNKHPSHNTQANRKFSLPTN